MTRCREGGTLLTDLFIEYNSSILVLGIFLVPMPPVVAAVRCHHHWSAHPDSDRMLRGLGQLGQAPGGRINYQLSDGCCRAAQLTAHQRW